MAQCKIFLAKNGMLHVFISFGNTDFAEYVYLQKKTDRQGKGGREERRERWREGGREGNREGNREI